MQDHDSECRCCGANHHPQLQQTQSDVSHVMSNIRAITSSSFVSSVHCFEPKKLDEIMACLLTEMMEQWTFSEHQGNAQTIVSLMRIQCIQSLHAKLGEFVELTRTPCALLFAKDPCHYWAFCSISFTTNGRRVMT
jgi:hypothetical protein